MVWGFSIAVTFVPLLVSQWAEIDKTALGLRNCLPISFQVLVNELSRIAFIGLPWPTNIMGKRCVALKSLEILCKSCNFMTSFLKIRNEIDYGNSFHRIQYNISRTESCEYSFG